MIAQREGEPIALRYAAAGYQTLILRYAVKRPLQEPLRDALCAVREIRAHAEEWGVDPEKICVTGYSAGGNLALWLASAALARGDAQALPDAMVLGYPSVSGVGCDPAFTSSQPELVSDRPLDGMPPTFLWTTSTDEVVPAQESLELGLRLHKAGVPLEMHVFCGGAHGLATADLATGRPDSHAAHWVELSLEWLEKVFRLNEIRTA